jgi:hypothetical protein
MRQKHQLTVAEFEEWRSLPIDNTDEGRAIDAWVFWNRVCLARDLDSGSLLAGLAPDKFSALPSDHALHWCWPMAFKCTRPPPEFEVPLSIREDIQ